MKKIAVFPGSFSPFTLGHKSVVDMALPLFDKIIVAIGNNPNKNDFFLLKKEKNGSQKFIKIIQILKYVFLKDLLLTFAKKFNINTLLEE